MTSKDTKVLKDLILWLRKERVAFVSLSAAGVTLDGVQDLKMVEQAKPEKPEPRLTMYERYGADLLRQPSAKPSDLVPDEALVE